MEREQAIVGFGGDRGQKMINGCVREIWRSLVKVSDVVIWNLGYSDDIYLVLLVADHYALLWSLRQKFVLNITCDEYHEYDVLDPKQGILF